MRERKQNGRCLSWQILNSENTSQLLQAFNDSRETSDGQVDYLCRHMLFKFHCVCGQQLWVLISNVMTYSSKSCQLLFMSSELLQSMLSLLSSKHTIIKKWILRISCWGIVKCHLVQLYNMMMLGINHDINLSVCHLYFFFFILAKV